jgi:hypothetical protein
MTSGVGWPAATSASGFRQVRLRLFAQHSDPAISMFRSTTRCSDSTVRDASGVLRDKRLLPYFPQLASEKKKRTVAPAPICEQQIGQMRA